MGMVGSFTVAPLTPTQPTSWARIKMHYRSLGFSVRFRAARVRSTVTYETVSHAL
jgi:hypothetical protein